MKLYTKAQVLEDIEKGTDDEVVQRHIDSVLKGWGEGKDDLDLQFSYDVICSNSKTPTVPEVFAPFINHEQLL